MGIFKPKDIIEPNQEMIEKSIKGNLNSLNLYGFVAFGLGVINLIYYIKLGTSSLEVLLGLIISLIFYIMHVIIVKIDKARLELMKAINNEVE